VTSGVLEKTEEKRMKFNDSIGANNPEPACVFGSQIFLHTSLVGGRKSEAPLRMRSPENEEKMQHHQRPRSCDPGPAPEHQNSPSPVAAAG
jgi:hypothetical protein